MNEGSSNFSCAKCQFLQIFEVFYACLSLLSSHFEGCSGQNQVEPLEMLILMSKFIKYCSFNLGIKEIKNLINSRFL